MIVSLNGTKRFFVLQSYDDMENTLGVLFSTKLMLRACFERGMVIIVSALIFL